MRIKRGDIVRIRLDPVEGSEQAGERPAVVISLDIINQHSPVIIVAAITSKKTDKIYPFEVLIHQPDGILNDLWQPVCPCPTAGGPARRQAGTGREVC